MIYLAHPLIETKEKIHILQQKIFVLERLILVILLMFQKNLIKKSSQDVKDILTKIHGGGALDRKRKLLEKQKKGKSRSKQFGKVEIPQEAFIGVLRINKDS